MSLQAGRGDRFLYYVAGVKVLTNLSAPRLPAHGWADASTTVIFDGVRSQKQRIARRCHVLQDPHFPPAYFDPEGSKVVIAANCSTDTADIAAQIRRVVPFASALQGKTILHASAVVAGLSVFAFVGPSGAGKSTLASQLKTLGYFHLADDLLPCRSSASSVFVPLQSPRRGDTLTVRAIFFLRREAGLSSVNLAPLSGSTFLQRLIVNGFGELGVPRMWNSQFMIYTNIVQNVRGFELIIPDNLKKLPSAASRIGEFILSAAEDSCGWHYTAPSGVAADRRYGI